MKATLYIIIIPIFFNNFIIPQTIVDSVEVKAGWNLIGALESGGIAFPGSGVTYPLTVSVDGMDMRLMDETGSKVNVNLKSGEDVVISDATIQKLKVTEELLPAVYALEQNYPNPFNPNTIINFALRQDSKVNLAVFNVLGEKVVQLADQEMKAGYHQIEFDASQFASGVYLYRIKAGDFIQTKKMVLIK